MKFMIADLKKKIFSYALILLLILLAFSGCGSQNSTSSNKGVNSKGIIKGTVTSASSVVFKGKPLLPKTAFAGNAGVAGAVCTLEGTDKSTTTDANGFFQMSDVPAGSYILICKKTATDGKVYAFLEIVEVQDGETVDLGTVDIKKTGGIQGKATLADLTDHTGISVYIPGTSMQARTDATGAYLINDVPEGTYELHFEKTGYMTGKITGLPVIAGETSLAEDMSISLSTGASGIISIENGKVYSNSRTVTVYITTSDDARLYQISDNPNFIGAVWNPIPPSRTWIFESDGEKRLYAKFADANGLESAPVSDSIVVDTTPPVNGSISINNGASATNSTSVTLNLSATDATTSVSRMKISNTPDFAGVEWESFVTTRSWTIPAGDGTKTVYVLFRDIVGNEITQALSDDIILDTTIPASPYVTIQEGAYTNNTQIHLNLSASGATFMKVSEDSTFAGIEAIPYAITKNITFSSGDGDKTIYVKYFDDAGNESDLISASVVLDTTPPTAPVIFNSNQTTNQTTFIVILSTPSTDLNFKTYQLKGGQYVDWTDTSETTSFSFTMTQQGANTLSIRGKDMAGNLSDEASLIISVDSISPTVSDIHVSVTVTTATITWNTSEPTSGKVDFGINQDYGSNQEDSNFTNSHSVQLTGLSGNTLYHYRITSTDTTGNVITSTDLTFTTVKIVAIDAGGNHTCAITSSDIIKCWGFNREGQLGDGSTTNRHSPVDVVGLNSGVIAVAAGWDHTCALTTSGSVKCWGDNSVGQLGIGNTTNHYTPVDVVGLNNGVTAISAGGGHTCALTTSGGVKCWGLNLVAQLGDGSNTNRYVPVDVVGLSTGTIAISAGNSQSCALTSSGGVKCWGQIGLGGFSSTQYSVPTDIAGLTSGITTITAGGDFICVISSSGGVKCFGTNRSGQLGDGSNSDRYTPVNVAGLTSGVTAISSRVWHTCALSASGGVKCWGYNGDGQIGDGGTTNRYSPVAVVGLSSGVYNISTGAHHSCALTISGGIKCWGDNSYGEIGDGSATVSYTPVDVMGFY